MRTSVLIVIGFAILAVTLAAKGSSAKKTRGVEKSGPTNADENENTDVASSSKPKKGINKSPSKKKPSKKATKQDDDDEIPESLSELLKDDDEIEIPERIEPHSDVDPIELGRKIKNVKNANERKLLIGKLRDAQKANENVFAGKFYAAALAATKSVKNSENKAQQFWNKQLKTAQTAMNNGQNSFNKTGAVFDNAVENARNIAKAGPLGILARRGESAALGGLSDLAKGAGNVTDFGWNTVGNLSKLVRAATFPVDAIPIASEIKNNFHDFIEENAETGKFLTGSFSDNASQAFANAAELANIKANEKDALLKKQFSSKRKLF